MKIIKYLSLIVAVALTVSCEKQEVVYDAEPTSGMAEFQLHYYVPVTSAAANNITKVEINGKLYANNKAPLNTYNVIPSGTTGRFYAVNPGNVNIKMYQGTDMATLVYDQNVNMAAGKQNVMVHSFSAVPYVFDNDYPYTGNLTEITDSICWIKFYNMLYENNASTPTTLRLQYQYIDYRTNLPVNIGGPVAFGESTEGWAPVTVVKDNPVSGGSRSMGLRCKVVDASGAIIGDLQYMNTSGAYVTWTGTQTLVIGRRYHHTFAGLRAATTATAGVRIFTAL
jgi:hypothetical protein